MNQVKPNIIMGIDPSLSNTGIFILNNSTGLVKLIKTINFVDKDKRDYINSLIQRKEKKFDSKVYQRKDKKDFVQKINNRQKENNLSILTKKEQNNYWTTKRLSIISSIIKEEIEINNVDTVVLESQVKKASLVQVVGSIKSIIPENCYYEEYEPTVWKKILTNNGKVDQKVLNSFTLNYLPSFYKHMNEHEIDAFCILSTFLKKNNLSMVVNG